MNKIKISVITFVTAFSVQGHAGLLYNYSQLATKDLDEMNLIVTSKVKESKKSYSGKNVPLKEALQAVYSRPNEDDLIEKIVAPLRTNLDELDAWEKTLSQLTDEAINALKHTKPFKPVVQVTYSIFLENFLSEVKPYLKKDSFEYKLVERIRDAKIEITTDAKNERSMRMMKESDSPSDIAENILKDLAKKNEKEAEKASAEK